MRENASGFWAKRLGLFRQVQNVCRQLSSVIPGMPVRLAGSTERGEKGKRKEGVSKSTPSFLAQSPDFHKLGLCYYLKILYL